MLKKTITVIEKGKVGETLITKQTWTYYIQTIHEKLLNFEGLLQELMKSFNLTLKNGKMFDEFRNSASISLLKIEVEVMIVTS